MGEKEVGLGGVAGRGLGGWEVRGSALSVFSERACSTHGGGGLGSREWGRSSQGQNMEALGRKEAKGRVLGHLDIEEKLVKETGNQKGSKISGNQEVA